MTCQFLREKQAKNDTVSRSFGLIQSFVNQFFISAICCKYQHALKHLLLVFNHFFPSHISTKKPFGKGVRLSVK